VLVESDGTPLRELDPASDQSVSASAHRVPIPRTFTDSAPARHIRPSNGRGDAGESGFIHRGGLDCRVEIGGDQASCEKNGWEARRRRLEDA
jgi:hypothetical protein